MKATTRVPNRIKTEWEQSANLTKCARFTGLTVIDGLAQQWRWKPANTKNHKRQSFMLSGIGGQSGQPVWSAPDTTNGKSVAKRGAHDLRVSQTSLERLGSGSSLGVLTAATGQKPSLPSTESQTDGRRSSVEIF